MLEGEIQAMYMCKPGRLAVVLWGGLGYDMVCVCVQLLSVPWRILTLESSHGTWTSLIEAAVTLR